MVNTITVPSEIKNKIKVLASKQNKTIKDIILEAISDIMKKYGVE